MWLIIYHTWRAEVTGIVPGAGIDWGFMEINKWLLCNSNRGPGLLAKYNHLLLFQKLVQLKHFDQFYS